MRTDLPSWRSLLFVPVTAEKFVRTGADRGADGIILDLEDAVAPSEKERARTLIADAIPQVRATAATCWCASTARGACWCATWRPR